MTSRHYRFSVAAVIRAFIFSGLCLVVHVCGVAQDVWRPLSPPKSNPNTPQFFGVVVDSKAKCTGKKLDSQVVISGRRGLGIYRLAFWVQNLSEMIPEKALWPYMGPDLGKEANCLNVVKLVILKGEKRKTYNLGLNVVYKGNYPEGASKDGSDLLDAHLENNLSMYSLIRDLSSGFDSGFAVIGESQFETPIEIAFSGDGITKALSDLQEIIGPPKSAPKISQSKKH